MFMAPATAQSAQSDAFIAAEAGRLLDHVKTALDRDLDAALKAAARLAEVLAIRMPAQTANLAFGGNGHTVYITSSNTIYRLDSKIRGNPPLHQKN